MSELFYSASEAQLAESVFERLGHPGKYTAVQSVANTQVDFTGSNYGYGTVIVGESNAAGTITLSGGGNVNIAHLTVGTVYELSPTKIVESGDKTVYVFKRQQ